MMTVTGSILTQETAERLAREAGFLTAGWVPLPQEQVERDAARFEQFIESGHEGTMQYLARRDEAGRLLRARTSVPFPWARSAILCLAGYNAAEPYSVHPAPEGSGWIARYAWSSRTNERGQQVPSDYHKVLKKRLNRLDEALRGQYGEFESRAFVDTGPVMERALATAAGLGWTGKNTCLIHPKLGSWNFLAVLLTSLELPDTETPLTVPDRCGSCRRCIDACPTNALYEPYRLNATLCISYLTIEHKGETPEPLRSQQGRQIFGCDICQDVCPWNRKAPVAQDADMTARQALVNPDLGWLAELEEADFERLFNGSPIRRAGFQGLRRNIAIAMGNSGLVRYTRELKNWIQAEDAGLRTAAQWALKRLEPGSKESEL